MLQEHEELRDGLSPLHSPVALSSPGTQFTCFTSTKVQILTPVALASQDQKKNRPVPTKGNTASRVEAADAALFRGIKAIY